MLCSHRWCATALLLLTQNKNSKESVDRRCSCRLLYLYPCCWFVLLYRMVYMNLNLFGGRLFEKIFFVRMILLKDPHAIGPDSFKNKYRCLDLWIPVFFLPSYQWPISFVFFLWIKNLNNRTRTTEIKGRINSNATGEILNSGLRS